MKKYYFYGYIVRYTVISTNEDRESTMFFNLNKAREFADKLKLNSTYRNINISGCHCDGEILIQINDEVLYDAR